jgi:multidrug efflux pump subunit AcrA (membrane-fusion protein)
VKLDLRSTLKKPWVVMPAVAVLALGGWMVVKPDGSSGSDPLPTSRTVEATRGTMARTVTAQGTVAAAQSEDLGFGSAGTVQAVSVKAGDHVTAGQVLATMDATQLAADVASAEASVAEAQARLDDHEEAGASSTQLAADRSSVQSAQDQLAEAQEALSGAQLVASFDGTVSQVNVTAGEQLSSSGTGGNRPTGSSSGSGATADQLGSGQAGGGGGNGSSTPDVQVISAGRYQVDLGVDSSDIDSIEAGQAVTVTLSSSQGSGRRGGFGFPGGGGGAFAFPGGGGAAAGNGSSGTNGSATQSQAASGSTPATGQVTEVSTIADASSGVASYPVTVEFTDDTGSFNVGATVEMAITIAEEEDVVQVPAFAVTTEDGSSTVTVSEDGKEETREVTTGLTSGTMVEITSGLEAGEQVVIRFGGARLGNGGGGAAGANGDGGGFVLSGPPPGAGG